jgi:hypothetical protein
MPATLRTAVDQSEDGEPPVEVIEQLSLDLRSKAFMSLQPAHSQFKNALDDISLEFRRQVLRRRRNSLKKEDYVVACEAVGDRLSELIEKYLSQSDEGSNPLTPA